MLTALVGPSKPPHLGAAPRGPPAGRASRSPCPRKECPMSADRYVISPPPQAAIAVAGSDKLFPVRRIWCVGRNYIEHIREMGQDERLPPFYFAKPADAVVPDGA